jgi:hypothetical protein
VIAILVKVLENFTEEAKLFDAAQVIHGWIRGK